MPVNINCSVGAYRVHFIYNEVLIIYTGETAIIQAYTG
jgi:hypothetical protein